jgi:hypothetical protein
MKPKNAADRLKAARASQADTTRQIAAHEAQRRDALLADDDNRAAELDRDLDELRRLAQRHLDKIALLGPVIEREQQERRFPHDLAGARERVTQLVQQQDRLRRKHKFDRSAADDEEFNIISAEIGILQDRVRQMERLQ